jgi:hypothetical protein
MELREIVLVGMDWIAQDRDQWKALLNTAVYLSIMLGNS